jgi:hypothetical protein
MSGGFGTGNTDRGFELERNFPQPSGTQWVIGGVNHNTFEAFLNVFVICFSAN